MHQRFTAPHPLHPPRQNKHARHHAREGKHERGGSEDRATPRRRRLLGGRPAGVCVSAAGYAKVDPRAHIRNGDVARTREREKPIKRREIGLDVRGKLWSTLVPKLSPPCAPPSSGFAHTHIYAQYHIGTAHAPPKAPHASSFPKHAPASTPHIPAPTPDASSSLPHHRPTPQTPLRSKVKTLGIPTTLPEYASPRHPQSTPPATRSIHQLERKETPRTTTNTQRHTEQGAQRRAVLVCDQSARRRACLE
ncbi:hypothetical protein K438DRAFT_1964315 [Mycena galopus ATCC 62051]|nr:hypothetical protein K438DRAFT_1964315 [Mycena galopus ATCC 62051]